MPTPTRPCLVNARLTYCSHIDVSSLKKKSRSDKTGVSAPLSPRALVIVPGVLALVLALAGCQSTSHSPYVSPRITGRVLDADTRQPLADVKVKRVDPDATPNVDSSRKGSQIIEQSRAPRTGQDGRFVLESERDLTLFRSATWYSVMISFEREGYLKFQTNYSSANVTSHSPKGEPFVNAGDILLRPSR